MVTQTVLTRRKQRTNLLTTASVSSSFSSNAAILASICSCKVDFLPLLPISIRALATVDWLLLLSGILLSRHELEDHAAHLLRARDFEGVSDEGNFFA